MLEGPIPDGFGKIMNSLELLDLSGNKLQGKIPSFFGNMCRLQGLYLSNNNLKGEISCLIQNSSWCNRDELRTLDLSYNQITGKIPESIRLLSGLEDLSLEGNSLEGPSFPGWLQTQSSLTILDISDNGLNESVPVWFWSKLRTMYQLNMSHNNLFGSIPNIALKLHDKPSIILSSNKFEYKVPSFLRQASQLLLSQNKFSDLSEFLCNQSTTANVVTLDLSKNQMTELPDCWKFVDPLRSLDLGNNMLSGNIPMSMGNLNKLSKGIPTCLKSFIAMSERSINRSETLSRIGGYNMTTYEIYDFMAVGGFKFDITWIWKGMEQEFPDPQLKLQSIDMSCNNLTGEIPKEVAYLLGLKSLNLSRNNLIGEIPSVIGNLSSLESLDLSGNQFYGKIASSLSQIDFLGKLDLSHNSLSGRIPSGRHLDTFDFSCFEGNVDLCGEQLNESCPGDHTSSVAVHGEDSGFYMKHFT
ncbi:unnamed protein product [Sphenostylis stenocarpa]|uniref:Uncharacterized protein n=1 Tax=Sphenostylis stenocarpa TaxID=92480 RepID=A0AA86SQ09_9FABA|nr:unnamed protein product [Sphenostylis stenocarpa]